MNYFLKKIGYKQNRLSIGLHRLSIALIIWIWMFSFIIFKICAPWVYHGLSNLLIWSFVSSFIIYLLFMLIALIISGFRYGFRQSNLKSLSLKSEQKINIFFFFSLRQMGIKKNNFFTIMQILGVVCAFLFFIPIMGFGLLFCFNCFGEHWPEGMSQEKIDQYIISRNDIGFGFPREEFLRMMMSVTIGSIFIYLSFIMLIWIISGFRYGTMRNENKWFFCI